MKLVINKSVFENVVSQMQPFLEKKDSSAITSHLYLEIANSKMTIKATDYEIGLEVIIDTISNFEDGKTTVNGNNLLGIIKRLKNENITLEANSNNLVIKQNKSSISFSNILYSFPLYRTSNALLPSRRLPPFTTTVLAPNSFKQLAASFISSIVCILLSIRSSTSGRFGVMTVT